MFIDGGGFILCWPLSDIVCNDLTLTATMTEMLIIDASAIIYGDFLIAGGYFGPTGGPDHIIEFKGNWLKTGGTFSVGTGVGKDPECVFSGTSKTYILNDTSGASYQNVLISGEIVISGTRLGQMNISQKLSVTGIMEINKYGLTICDIDLSGVNAGFDVFTGVIKGTGRFWYRYRSNSVMPITGTINIRYWRFYLVDSTCTIQARTYSNPCEVEFDYNLDGQTLTLLSVNRHYFYKLTVRCDLNPCSGTLDFATNNAEIWCENTFNIYKYAFPNGTFTLNLGNGTHVFRGSVDFYFSYTSATTHLVVDAAEGTIILYPVGLRSIVLPP